MAFTLAIPSSSSVSPTMRTVAAPDLNAIRAFASDTGVAAACGPGNVMINARAAATPLPVTVTTRCYRGLPLLLANFGIYLRREIALYTERCGSFLRSRFLL